MKRSAVFHRPDVFVVCPKVHSEMVHRFKESYAYLNGTYPTKLDYGELRFRGVPVIPSPAEEMRDTCDRLNQGGTVFCVVRY